VLDKKEAEQHRHEQRGDYRCPDGSDTAGGTRHDTKKTRHEHGHDTMDVVSVSARHDDGLCLGHDLGTQCQHEHDTKMRPI
jgi:hypothetical protein